MSNASSQSSPSGTHDGAFGAGSAEAAAALRSAGPGQGGADLPPDAFTPPTAEDVAQGRQLFSEYAQRYPRLPAATCALTIMAEPYKSQALATVDALCRHEPWASIPPDLLIWWFLDFVHFETPGQAPFVCRILRRLALMLAHAGGQALSESDLAWLATPEPMLRFVQALEGQDVTEKTASLFEEVSRLDGAGLEKAMSKIGWLVREAGKCAPRAAATRLEPQCCGSVPCSPNILLMKILAYISGKMT